MAGRLEKTVSRETAGDAVSRETSRERVGKHDSAKQPHALKNQAMKSKI